jgi:hypothetical protein
MSYTTNGNIRIASDVNGKPVLGTRDGSGNTEAYKFYTDTLDVGSSPVVLDVETDLGRYGSTGYIQNLTASQIFTVEFSIDGTTYGDAINVRSTYVLNLEPFVKFKKIRLTRVSADTSFEALIV